MTPVVFISGMHISDNGNLVIDADEMDAAGVKSVEFIEGTPEARIAELSARLEEYNRACETLGIKKDVLAYISGLRTGYDMEIEALEARLKEANARANIWEKNYAIGSPKRYALINRAEKAEADAGRLRDALKMVEWLWIGDENQNHPTSLICPWCKQRKGHPRCEDLPTQGHKPDCARQAALSPAEQAEEAKGVKG